MERKRYYDNKGIRLFTENDNTLLDKNFFLTEPRHLRNSYYGRLIGKRTSLNDTRHSGISIENGQWKRRETAEYHDEGYFNLSLLIENQARKGRRDEKVLAGIYIPVADDVLVSEVRLKSSRDAMSAKEGTAQLWKLPYSSIPYRFYLPPNPELLQSLEFFVKNQLIIPFIWREIR